MFLMCKRTIGFVAKGKTPFFRSLATRVLGIETSCDDTAVAVVDSKRNILYSQKINDTHGVALLGGISPSLAASNHRIHIDEIIRDCTAKCLLRLSDLDAVAVSTRPGLVLSLKVGTDKALALAREHYLRFISVHHMRAHAIVARMLCGNLTYPFLALLISGGHALIVLVRGAENFEILGDSLGSPGECLDKVARALNLSPIGPHYGFALEKVARNADKDGHLSFQIRSPVTSGAQFNFSSIKNNCLYLVKHFRPTETELSNFCASVQFTVMSHLCRKLDFTLQFLQRNGQLEEFGDRRTLVVSGGVASNAYFIGCIRHLMARYSFHTFAPPPRLCTDNGEMVAWLGMELLLSGSKDVCEPHSIPHSIYLEAQSPIGRSRVEEVCQRNTPHKLNVRELHAAAS